MTSNAFERIEALGKLVNGHPENVEGALPQLLPLLATAASSEELAAAITALGHTSDQRAFNAVRGFSEHVDPRVRLAVAQAIIPGHDELTSSQAETLIANTTSMHSWIA